MITQDNRSKKIELPERDELSLLAGKTIGELTAEKFPGLLVFPRDFKASEDLNKDTVLYSIENNHLVTNNIVGFIGFTHTQLTIRSRFAEENEEDYFLHYMLQKVLSLNITELKHKTADEQGVQGWILCARERVHHRNDERHRPKCGEHGLRHAP